MDLNISLIVLHVGGRVYKSVFMSLIRRPSPQETFPQCTVRISFPFPAHGAVKSKVGFSDGKLKFSTSNRRLPLNEGLTSDPTCLS